MGEDPSWACRRRGAPAALVGCGGAVGGQDGRRRQRASSGTPVAALQAMLDAERDRYGAPGAVAVVRVGDRRWAVTTRDRRQRARHARWTATDTTRFRIASITKPIVAALVLDAVAQGKLALDDVVADLLPGVIRGPADHRSPAARPHGRDLRRGQRRRRDRRHRQARRSGAQAEAAGPSGATRPASASSPATGSSSRSPRPTSATSRPAPATTTATSGISWPRSCWRRRRANRWPTCCGRGSWSRWGCERTTIAPRTPAPPSCAATCRTPGRDAGRRHRRPRLVRQRRQRRHHLDRRRAPGSDAGDRRRTVLLPRWSPR